MTTQIRSHCLVQSLEFVRHRGSLKCCQIHFISTQILHDCFLLWGVFSFFFATHSRCWHIAIKSQSHCGHLSTIQCSRMCHLMKFYVKQCTIFYAIIFTTLTFTIFYSQIGYQIFFSFLLFLVRCFFSGFCSKLCPNWTGEKKPAVTLWAWQQLQRKQIS